MIIPVILCGGSGTRLWPLSRKAYPKQLLPLSSSYSMLQETIMRVASIPGATSPIVICNVEHRFIVAEQLAQIGISDARILLEPEGKNTAPAVALAALIANPEDVLLIVPSDHQIKNAKQFIDAVVLATTAAASGGLITFGIKPERAEMGYGYIKQGAQIAASSLYHVEIFVEKPDLKRATAYLEAGDYYWNSGMFMFTAGEYLAELAAFRPDIQAVCEQAIASKQQDMDFIRLDAELFAKCPAESIDYAVMEKSQKIALIPLKDSLWSDLGSWGSVYDAKDKDQNDNVVQGDVYLDDVNNCYLHAEDRLLAVVGVKDHIVVETADAVLVAHKDASQDVKKIVERMQAEKRQELEYHRRVYRPWGYYEVLDESVCFKVKQILVKPGAHLSLQSHQYRSEHWVVISGQATVTCDDKTFCLQKSESTFIPVKSLHRLSNETKQDLVIVEVQTGSYVGEDDIQRFDDHYGREVQCA